MATLMFYVPTVVAVCKNIHKHKALRPTHIELSCIVSKVIMTPTVSLTFWTRTKKRMPPHANLPIPKLEMGQTSQTHLDTSTVCFHV